MIQLADHFQSDDSRRHSEWLRQRQWFIKAKHDQERREKIEEKLDDDLAAFASEVIMASEARIAAFEVKLDTYDEATVAALMENLEILEQLHAERDAMLERAFVMEDGRRVFKSEDGSFVIDEFGADVSVEEIDPAMIADHHPSAESYLENLASIEAATAEREAILDYQAKLDDAREQTANGEISEVELDDLDADLLDAMPDSVRAHAGVAIGTAAPDLTASFASPSQNGGMPNVERKPFAYATSRNVEFSPVN